ncbi:MAG: hypothetical protein EXQ84_06820 [Rhodospirillaceae bacterium]|nr:hypothetical protein [Rhodospirillaceae bacterium]
MFLRRALDDARFYQANRRDYDRGQARSMVLPRADFEALIPVLERKMPLVLRVFRESDIRQAIALAADYKVRVVLLSASEGWKAADALAKAGIPVIADPLDNLPSRFESLSASLENVPKLMKAGVMVAFATTGDALENRYRALAVANGISRDQALAAITKNPAEIWGIADSYGTLEKGKDADVVIWSGDPLELSSIPTALFIRGQAQNLSSRQSKLRDRYKNLKSAEPPFGYR